MNFNIKEIKQKIANIASLVGIKDATEFYNQLKINDCIISGSYMLHILNETEFNDIDIFHVRVTEESWYKFDFGDYFGNYLEKNGLIKTGNNISNPEDWYLGINSVFCVYDFQKPGYKKIQLIQLNQGTNIDNFINNHFDISVCKNYFYPKTDELSIFDATGIQNKTFTYERINDKSECRFQKYIDRGYTCININQNNKN